MRSDFEEYDCAVMIFFVEEFISRLKRKESRITFGRIVYVNGRFFNDEKNDMLFTKDPKFQHQ